jgi:hypothetical protein
MNLSIVKYQLEVHEKMLPDAVSWLISETERLTRDLKAADKGQAILTTRITELEAERDTAYQKGQEDMRERAARECAGYYKDYRSDYGMILAESIRALPIK